MLVRLNTLVQNQIAAAAPAQGSVVASVPLAPTVAQDLNNAAAAKHQSPAAYMADLLAKAAGGK